MSVRTSLRLGSALLGLTLVAAACSGAAGNAGEPGSAGTAGSTGRSGSGTAASPMPTFDLGSLLSPDPGQPAGPGTSQAAPVPGPTSVPVAQQPTQDPAGSTTAPISTTEASSLLAQVDSLLKEVDSELSNADAAANNPGE
ncbi:MAG: hypothetical protein ACRDGI_10580 [Candidatus Limnocylindrales bacterium]